MLGSFHGLLKADLYRDLLLGVLPFNVQTFGADVRHRLQSIWRDVDGLDPRVHGKKLWRIITGVLSPCVKSKLEDRVCLCQVI